MNKMEKETIERYDEIAEEYDRDWRGKHDKTQLEHLKNFEEMIGPAPKKILDAGCGTGKDCIYFASHNYNICGIDLSSQMMNRAIKNFKTRNLKAAFLLEDMRSISFSNDYFDGIWTSAAIVHFCPEDKEKVIQEFYRVLKPEGILRIEVQNFLSIKHLKRFVQSYFSYLINSSNVSSIEKIKSLKARLEIGYTYLDKRHWFYPSKQSLLKILNKNGFSVLKTNHIFSKRISIYAKKI